MELNCIGEHCFEDQQTIRLKFKTIVMKTPGNPSKSLILALICLIHCTTFSQPIGWQWQNPYLQGNDLNSIVMNGSIG
jgi:hypothetical protein